MFFGKKDHESLSRLSFSEFKLWQQIRRHATGVTGDDMYVPLVFGLIPAGNIERE